jgi:hypothetical protein
MGVIMSDILRKKILHDIETFKGILASSETMAEISNKYGFSNHGRNTSVISSIIRDLELSNKHLRTNRKSAVREKRQCPNCGKEFEVSTTNKKDSEKICCGHTCANIYFSWKQGTKNRRSGSACYNKDLREYYSKNNRDFICCNCEEQHKLAMEVHHLDENKHNNSLDNLVPLCVKCHRIYHHGQEEEKAEIFDSIIEELDIRDKF